jgi:hypothetical protein
VVPVALTAVAFLVVRSMARTALRLDDAQAAQIAARSVMPPIPPGW